jgi:hypothetical protein
MKIQLAAVFGFLMVFAAGCGTAALDLKELEPKGGEWTGTAILFNYDLSTTDTAIRTDGCSLTLHELETDRDYVIQLAGQKHSVLFEIPAGVYKGKVLACPHYSKGDLGTFVNLEPGKINYLGETVFEFDHDSNLAKMTQADQTETARSLAGDFKALPAAWRTAVYNPFTHRPITEAMVDVKSAHQLKVSTKHFLKKGETAASTSVLESNLKGCDAAEQKKYPYRVGTLSYAATYEKRVLQSLKKEGENSFSNDFVSCVEQTVRDFRPDSDAKVDVKVTL